MSSHSIYPEKIALYFSNMNPLSAKILADIQAVENSSINSGLTYSEKSKIIDKHLIYDVIQRHKNQQQSQKPAPDSHNSQFDITEDEEGNHVFDDPELDKDHEQALLQSVYPKRPEKYIYDDNTVYLDEHSEPFSYCTRNQTKFCELENLINDAPKNRSSALSSKHLPFHFLSKSDSKSRLPASTGITGTPSSVTGERRSHREKKHAPPAPPLLGASMLNKRLSSDYDSDHSTNSNMNDPKFTTTASSTESVLESPTRTPKKGFSSSAVPVFGVPIMGFPQSNSSSALAKSDKKYSHTNHEESNLPQQVQNLDLIAELQAKLKLNKTKPPNPPPQQHASPSTTKVTKPKAPPPPPPSGDLPKKLPGSAVKITSPILSPPKPSSPKSDLSPKASQKTDKDEDFNVDVSSPCKIVSTKNVIYNKIDASKNESTKRYSTFIILAANPEDEPKDGHSFGNTKNRFRLFGQLVAPNQVEGLDD